MFDKMKKNSSLRIPAKRFLQANKKDVKSSSLSHLRDSDGI